MDEIKGIARVKFHSEAVVFERYRDADAAIEHFANISHLMEPIMATASVTGEVLGTPNAKMKSSSERAARSCSRHGLRCRISNWRRTINRRRVSPIDVQYPGQRRCSRH